MFHRFRHKDCIARATEALLESYASGQGGLEHLGYELRPSRADAIRLIEDLFEVLFPGYFGTADPDRDSIRFHVGSKLNEVYENLSRQLYRCFRHRCRGSSENCGHCGELSERITASFVDALPELRRLLAEDVQAAFDGDPAAKSLDEIIFCYPGFFALTVHRLAHRLLKEGAILLPRFMTEYAHERTGIDIHPGATIGRFFFMDHGTGIVIGETTHIGERVKIYQGVTLGALSFPKDERGNLIRGVQRHPTLEDDVVIYAGATVLGGETVIGKGAVIGGNTWVLRSVPPGYKVLAGREDEIPKVQA